jgi:hypothetical protein
MNGTVYLGFVGGVFFGLIYSQDKPNAVPPQASTTFSHPPQFRCI